MASRLQLLYIFILGCGLVLGKPMKESKAIESTETQKSSRILMDKSANGKIIACLFNNKSNKYICAEVKPHQQDLCNDLDPDCLKEHIYDAKPGDQSSKHHMDCLKNPFCKERIFGRRKRSQLKEPLAASPPNQIQSAFCNPRDVRCLVTKRGFLRASTRPLIKRKATVETARDCDFIRDPSCIAGAQERGLMKNEKRQKKVSCKFGKLDKICRWRPQPVRSLKSQIPRDVDVEQRS